MITSCCKTAAKKKNTSGKKVPSMLSSPENLMTTVCRLLCSNYFNSNYDSILQLVYSNHLLYLWCLEGYTSVLRNRDQYLRSPQWRIEEISHMSMLTGWSSIYKNMHLHDKTWQDHHTFLLRWDFTLPPKPMSYSPS